MKIAIVIVVKKIAISFFLSLFCMLVIICELLISIYLFICSTVEFLLYYLSFVYIECL